MNDYDDDDDDDDDEQMKKMPNNNKAWNVDTDRMLIIHMIL
jgi:hypothetical protein